MCAASGIYLLHRKNIQKGYICGIPCICGKGAFVVCSSSVVVTAYNVKSGICNMSKYLCDTLYYVSGVTCQHIFVIPYISEFV